jgi:two-component system, chemotaxis family, protein-glutamate methylesterase/glutaminase
VTDQIRVLVVDDSPFVRRAVERMLDPLPGVTVVGSAGDGREGVEQVRRLRPDVVILDLMMPRLDGLQAIREIMESAPTPILVLSSHARPGADLTLRALDLGAVDFVSKTEAGTRMDIHELAPLLHAKVLAIAGSRPPPAGVRSKPEPVSHRRPPPSLASAVTAPYDLLVIGASTGGPRALATLLGGLPADLPAGTLVAQHMPPGFTAALAERLDSHTELRVREARDGDVVEPGLVLVGVGGRQLQVERDGERLIARVLDSAEGLVHRPSVDLLFRSAAEAAGGRVVAVVLTGMGQDGAAGMASIRRAGGRGLIESEDSAVIYGMPRAARASAEQALPVDRLPEAILRLFQSGGG